MISNILLVICSITLLSVWVAIHRVTQLRQDITDLSYDIIYNQITLLWLSEDYYQVALWAERIPPEILEIIRERIEKDKIRDWEVLLKLI